MSRAVKSVSFNICDPIESKLYEYSLQYPNFSRLIKHLIQNQINNESSVQAKSTIEQSQINPTKEIPLSKEINPNLMKQLI